MRVLHFFKTYWPETFGGVERTIHAIATTTREHGVTSEVLSLSRDPVKNSVEFDGHFAGKARLMLEVASTGLSVDAIGGFAGRARHADVVHYHFPWPYMDAVHFLSRHGKPSLVTYHSDIVKQKRLMTLYRPLMRRFLGDVDRIVCTSPNYLATSAELSPFRDRVSIIEIGLSEHDYPVPEEGLLARWRQLYPRPFFLFTGVLRYYKGLQVLIEAARLSGLSVVIVGTGPMEAELKDEAKDLENVHFAGPVSDADKAALLTLCRAFVFPSHLRSEAFGLSLVEAAMFARPMISCEIGTGTSYINIDGETGLIVPPSNAEALTGAMQRLADSPSDADRFGKAARRRYDRLFTARRMGASYAALYRSLLDERSQPGPER